MGMGFPFGGGVEMLWNEEVVMVVQPCACSKYH